ncbi:hypothetical protein JK386_11185 [Nocardioides sp. zg-536]|uniref:Uncharacterized protein n=1 Tax=Nocardioides faecalis TaxID=2803858 RepID=A0A939BWD3_9ACTN|nr:hypothetical protein [Nocardioides faecalis]MBM9460467.1 hypothetical protein [Nocardioides faecalis]QVI59718.1 hypothetical protein KG111_05075 [Nocardioides faecalis]
MPPAIPYGGPAMATCEKSSGRLRTALLRSGVVGALALGLMGCSFGDGDLGPAGCPEGAVETLRSYDPDQTVAGAQVTLASIGLEGLDDLVACTLRIDTTDDGARAYVIMRSNVSVPTVQRRLNENGAPPVGRSPALLPGVPIGHLYSTEAGTAESVWRFDSPALVPADTALVVARLNIPVVEKECRKRYAPQPFRPIEAKQELPQPKRKIRVCAPPPAKNAESEPDDPDAPFWTQGTAKKRREPAPWEHTEPDAPDTPFEPPSVPPGPDPWREPEDVPGACRDVTSYDYNWDNDVLCTRSDGSQFYTSYEGADAFLGRY